MFQLCSRNPRNIIYHQTLIMWWVCFGQCVQLWHACAKISVCAITFCFLHLGDHPLLPLLPVDYSCLGTRERTLYAAMARGLLDLQSEEDLPWHLKRICHDGLAIGRARIPVSCAIVPVRTVRRSWKVRCCPMKKVPETLPLQTSLIFPGCFWFWKHSTSFCSQDQSSLKLFQQFYLHLFWLGVMFQSPS